MVLSGRRDIAKQVAELVLKTVSDNVEALKHLSDEFREVGPEAHENGNRQARLITFACTAIEKLLMLNLYSRNPLLLLPSEQIKKSHLFKDTTYEFYDSKWLFEQSSGFIDPTEMWKILDALIDLSDFSSDYHYVKQIRNKYLHAFILEVAPKSFYLIRYHVWLLIRRLLEDLPEDLEMDASDFLRNAGVDEDDIERFTEFDEEKLKEAVLSTFPEALNELSKLKTQEEKREWMLLQFYKPEFLNQDVTIRDLDGEPKLIMTPEDELTEITEKRSEIIKRSEANIDCPVCLEEREKGQTGFVSIEPYEIIHRQDNEGDYMIFEEPVDAILQFEHFYCICCGFHSSDSYLLEKLGYEEVLEKEYWFGWSVGEGATNYYETDGESYGVSLNH